jgi:5-methylcytosine-specific restriction endonuclease McrA
MQAAALSLPTLVLNRNWSPIRTTSTREALGLVAGGSARIVDPITYAEHDLDSWDAVSRAAERFDEARIRSMRLSLVPPEVIVLTQYSGFGTNTVVFSRKNLFRRDAYTCQYCGAQPGTGDLTIDHVVARSKGGRSTWTNCVVACFRCNLKKSDRTPEEAGMRLRAKPERPRWTPVLAVAVGRRRESWSRFLSRAYWEVELEP